MDHAFIVKMNRNGKYGNIEIFMPWLFTTMKEACLYGEYKYQKDDCESYRVIRIDKPSRFYALK